MSFAKVMTGAGFALAALAGSPALAENGEWAWASYSSASGEMTVDLPCSADEVEMFVAFNPPIQGRQADPKSLVGCQKGPYLFMAGRLTAPDSEPLDKPIFEALLDNVSKDAGKTSAGVTVETLAGRRAIVGNQSEGERTAQTGVLEHSERAYLMLLAGGPFGEVDEPREVQPMIDRFFASVKATGE